MAGSARTHAADSAVIESGCSTIASCPLRHCGALPTAVAAEQACREPLGQGVSTLRRNLDPRLQRALTWLDEHLDDGLGNRAVVHAAGASESWLSHHFGDRVGVPIRRYVLWRRLRLAIEAALGGASLTDAAHAADFSDSAHLTRTFHETFGVAPSFLFGDRQAIRVHFIS